MKFYLEKPSINRQKEVLEVIEEYYNFKSTFNGIGSLKHYLNNYEKWLKYIKKESKQRVTKSKVPTNNYFLIRKEDNKLIGFINIRLKLNNILKKYGGNIGYSIRPTERGNGYSKILLYLGLLECQKYNIKEVLISAKKENKVSCKTIEALGGVKTKTTYNDKIFNEEIKNYIIDVGKSISKYKYIYNCE